MKQLFFVLLFFSAMTKAAVQNDTSLGRTTLVAEVHVRNNVVQLSFPRADIHMSTNYSYDFRSDSDPAEICKLFYLGTAQDGIEIAMHPGTSISIGKNNFSMNLEDREPHSFIKNIYCHTKSNSPIMYQDGIYAIEIGDQSNTTYINNHWILVTPPQQ